MIAKQILNNTIIPVGLNDTPATALSLMDDFKLMHLPVVDDNKYVGIISEKDVYDINDFDSPIKLHIAELNKHYVKDFQHIYDVLRLSSELHLSLIPVIDSKSNYIGAVTLPDLMNSFARMFSVNNPGGIIVLEMSYNDYSLSEISQIVESNNAKVLSLFITSWPDSTKIELSLKINTLNIAPVIQTFNRYDYIIKASFTENTEFSDLKERYDSLMRYLDV